MKKILIAISILISISFLNAKGKHSLGLAVGISSGTGLSYRFFNQSYGYQCNFIALGSKENFVIPLGFKGMTIFHQTKHSKAYYLADSSVFMNFGTESDKEYVFSVGAGIGMEFNILNNLHFSLDLPLTCLDLFETVSTRAIIFPFPEFGLHYYF